MIVDRQREKLLNAITYFVNHTKHCHTLKLFKLLFFLDFEHYRQTGRTVTGQMYVAWPNGPAPNALWHEIKKGGEADLQKQILIAPIKDDITDKVLRRDLKPKAVFRKDLFSKREFAIMDRLAFYFAETKGEDMSDFSHRQKQPWIRVYGKGEGKGREIPADFALDAEPLIDAVPTIEADEVRFRKDLLAGLQ